MFGKSASGPTPPSSGSALVSVVARLGVSNDLDSK
jgi:hypothetical protein